MKKMFLPLAVIALLPLLFLSGCNDDEVETVPLGPVNIDLYESLFNNGRELYLQVFTDQGNYPITYFIRNSAEVNGNNIEVTLHDIEKISADGYQVALGPASAYINLGYLEPGQYSLEINVVDATNQATLDVIEDLYAVASDQLTDLTFNYDTLYRIPNGALWGYAGYQNTAYTEIAEAFRDSLNAFGAVPLSLPKGNYGYFQVSESGEFTQPINDQVTYYREFFKDYTGSESRLNNLLDYYMLNYRQIDIQLYWVFEGNVKSAIIRPGNDPVFNKKLLTR